MLTRLLLAILNGVITYIVLLILVVILGMVRLGAIGGVIEPFIWAIAVLVAALTFLGVLPNYWSGLIR
jgi:hypothetical protein